MLRVEVFRFYLLLAELYFQIKISMNQERGKNGGRKEFNGFVKSLYKEN